MQSQVEMGLLGHSSVQPNINQKSILIDAINAYLKWRNNKYEPDGRGYALGFFTWLRHFTAFGEKRANALKTSLSSNSICEPIRALQEHFKKDSTINNHSLDTYLLESILNIRKHPK